VSIRCLLGTVIALTLAPAHAQVNGKQVLPRATAGSVAATTSVRSLYVVHCAGCHGVDGAGSRVGNVPDMRQLGAFLRVPGGREFVIKVPGVMGSGLDDAQVAQVTNWVLATVARASVPEDHAAYTAVEVTRARERPLVDVAAARRRLVEDGRSRGIAIE
jgi:mono/diheme cytochrome c family protein